MGYRIVLLQNGEYKKTMYRSRTLNATLEHLNKFVEESSRVLFPRKYVNTNKITEIKYEIFAVKDFAETDTMRMVRDGMGRLYKEEPLFDIWTIIENYPYQMEESFYIYGYNPTHDRKDLKFVMGLMMKNIADPVMSKSIVVLNNKLLIYNEDQFDMVICKCPDDCRRLYDILKAASLSKNYKRIIFMGEANAHYTNQLYKMIMEETGWDYRKVTRTTTAPTNHK